MKIYGFYIDPRLTMLDFDEFVFLLFFLSGLRKRIANLYTVIYMDTKTYFHTAA